MPVNVMNLLKNNMTNPQNGFSDSQESALLDEEAYHELAKEIDINYLLTNDVIEEEPEEEIEQKYDIHEDEKFRNEIHFGSQGKFLRNEEQRQYLPSVMNPEPESSVPISEEFAGHLNFQLLPICQNGGKHWVYSQKLKKVFINMEQTLPLRFKWEPPLDGLYLRTTMVFNLDQYRNDPVQRCHNHMAPTNRINQGITREVLKHVVRCMDPQSIYEDRHDHLSIVTPLRTPQAGSQYVQMYFKFLCKNSCPSGMNRRPTDLIFTLEDHENRVLGRRKLSVRVCSCPKRDKEKEESEQQGVDAMPCAKKRKLNPSVGKKILMPSCDTHVFNLQLNIVGKENYLAVMKYAYDIMAGQAARTGQYEFFKPYMDAILHKQP